MTNEGLLLVKCGSDVGDQRCSVSVSLTSQPFGRVEQQVLNLRHRVQHSVYHRLRLLKL